ncbi:sugar phosphate isomerase/epimerase family protein [Flagellimonas allohymeniacidonis]|uniref:Sugar phosphate isomerase/epimerase n=1 Tax=Flagellimonas allohymeniacidonis TaxID=2517819 RepID=A0A4Q8QAV3_9FLAO|nr:sugar phosphate isomerase/epimerase family protein [Allomuricauda hymeniacidonis]TAI47391.1 sugar phosphate isomerase/epimerase [Allomuricauda hymeniacidonis]
MKRRYFTRNGLLTLITISILGFQACKQKKEQTTETATEENETEMMSEDFKLSLAQWSIHRMIQDEGLDPYQFAAKAKEWGFSGLEYVSQLYEDELKSADFSKEAMDNFVQKSLAESQKHGLTNLIIMIDHEGDLSAADETERKAAVESHFKWVDAAAALGCHSVRVNLMGSKVADEWTEASVDGLTQLSNYAKDKNINVIVENHGGLSSNAAMLVEVIKRVNLPNCGTLPDFGNFCVQREDGSYFESECIEEYDRYKGITELMPYAKAVSAKSHDFDENGNEINTDYARMIKIVKDAGYSGYIGVEYEGSELGEEEGIQATKALLEKLLSAE